MEDKIQFKVYTYWKDQDKPEVRRFGIDKAVVTSFCYLDAKLQEIFPRLKQKRYSVSWKDEDGDNVTISSDDEMIIALTTLSNDNTIKLYVYSKDEEPQDIDCDVVITATAGDAPEDANMSHFGVVCDICDAAVVGFRYKCTTCLDFDLCSKCEAAGHHAEHIMVRVPMPNMPRTTIRAAIRKSRHILKSVASAMTEQECPYKRSKRDRSADKRRRGDRCHNGDGKNDHHHRDTSRGEHYHRRPRTSWLETFATYMNEFANLAGDVGIELDKKTDTDPKTGDTPKEQRKTGETSKEQTKPGETTKEQIKTGETSKEQTATKANSKPSVSTTSEAVFTQCKEHSTEKAPENIQKLLGLVYGTDLNELLSQFAKSHLGKGEINQQGQGDRKSSEVDKESSKSEVSSTTSNETKDIRKKEESPEKAEGWTVINNEKDLMDVDANIANPSAPYEPAAPIGFNLPEEFQERVKVSKGQTLYPPLHGATAVLNLKEPECHTQSPEPTTSALGGKQNSKPAPSANKTKASPKPEPTPRHPNPLIDAAIRQMLAMGYTNNGGWLTALLENVNGDIAAALDHLSVGK